jgi:hypothetical protein
MMQVTDRLFAPSRVTAEEAIAALDREVGGLGDHDRTFARALAAACNETGIDFAIAYSHCGNETNLFTDDNWNVNLNPAGIGIDGVPGHTGPVFPDATASARFYVALLLLKISKGDDVGAFETERDTAPTFFDGTREFAQDPTFPTVTTLDDLRLRFGPNDRECVWMCDQSGPLAIVEKATRLFPDLPEQGFGHRNGAIAMGRQLSYVLVDAGHRETGVGGADANPDERELTDDLAEEYVTALRAAGYRADWYQRDVDNDALPRDTDGTLTDVALGANARLAQETGDNLLYVSCHYNGAHSPFHVIYPDETGLVTAIAGGAPGNDTEANNPLDTELARVIAVELGKIPGMVPLQNAGKFPGTMSETKTGVAEQFGARLAVFAATVPVRDRCVRLVVEHGGTEDDPAKRPTFTQDCAAAIVRALATVYQPGNFPQRRVRVGAAGLIDFNGAPEVSVQVQDPDRFECIQGTTLRTYPNRDAPAGVRTPAKQGRNYRFGFTATIDGEKWLVSRAGSWGLATAFKELN